MSVEIVTAEEFAALAARVAELEARLAAPPEQSDWLTIPAAALYLGRSEEAARKFIDRNHIDKHQEIKGGTVTVLRDDLDATLTRNRRSPR